MKRKNNLYKNIYNFENILDAFNEVCRNTKNKSRVANLKEYKCIVNDKIRMYKKWNLKMYKICTK